MKKTTGAILTLLTLLCALWVTPALAIPSYQFTGYTNTLFLNDGEFDGYGTFTLTLTGGVADSASQVSGLTGTLQFDQDPGYNNLPGGISSFGGIFAESFYLFYDAASGLLDLSTDPTLTSMLSVSVGSTFDLLAIQPLTDLTGNYFAFDTITGTIDGLLVDFSTDELAYAAVPEPSTILLLGTGLIGVAFLRRRKAA